MGEKVPLIIAHRGARREAPENTIPAIARAIELRAGGVEFDVLLTKDKVPIVTHNDDLSILTHHRGHVRSTPFSIVKGLDFGSHFSAKFADITAPTLTEVLELVLPHDILTIVEIKTQRGMGVTAARLVGGILSDFRFCGPIMVSSFSFRMIRELGRLFPKIPRALTLRFAPLSFARAKIAAKIERLTALHPSIKSLTKEMVSYAHARNLQIQTWTVNSDEEFRRCIELNVDGIITDDIRRFHDR